MEKSLSTVKLITRSLKGHNLWQGLPGSFILSTHKPIKCSNHCPGKLTRTSRNPFGCVFHVNTQRGIFVKQACAWKSQVMTAFQSRQRRSVMCLMQLILGDAIQLGLLYLYCGVNVKLTLTLACATTVDSQCVICLSYTKCVTDCDEVLSIHLSHSQ